MPKHFAKQPPFKLRQELVINEKYSLLNLGTNQVLLKIYIGPKVAFCTNPEEILGYYIRHEFREVGGTAILSIPDNMFNYEVLSDKIY